MGKAPSVETQLRTAKSEIKSLERQLRSLHDQSNDYRDRAFNAETELVQWKTRFDLLLKNMGKVDMSRVKKDGE